MYAWITARRVREGMMDEFLKACHDPGISPPISPSSPQGPTVYSLQPTDNPNEMWGVGFFDSLETIRHFQTSPQMEKRREALAPYIEEVLWERIFEAHPWDEAEHPLHYAVYIRTAPNHRYRLAVVTREAREAIRQADALLDQARNSGCENPEWTMRAFESGDDAPDTLPPTAGHMHIRPGQQQSAGV